MSQHEINTDLLFITISVNTITSTPRGSRSGHFYSTIEATIPGVQPRSVLHRPDLLFITGLTGQEGQKLWERLGENLESSGIRRSLSMRAKP
ncbi:hypothetical protein N7453_000979 [Penicillium expansum]|nr:hypothetical protein N7453_000979 [Penicillium expansum]